MAKTGASKKSSLEPDKQEKQGDENRRVKIEGEAECGGFFSMGQAIKDKN